MQPPFVTSTYRITGLRYTYGCPTSSAAYVRKLYLLNKSVPLHLWMRNFKCSLRLSTLPRGSLRYVTLMVPISSTAYVSNLYLQNHAVTLHLCLCDLYCSLSLLEGYLQTQGLNYTYRRATLSAAYVCKLYLQNCWITVQVWVSNLECSLSLLAPRTETLGYTTLMGAPF